MLRQAGGISSSCGIARIRIATPQQFLHQLAIPNDSTFVGIALRDQVLQVEIDQAFNITQLEGSNGLLLTIGVF